MDNRQMQALSPPRIIVPGVVEEGLRRVLDAHSAMDGCSYDCDVRPCTVSSTLDVWSVVELTWQALSQYRSILVSIKVFREACLSCTLLRWEICSHWSRIGLQTSVHWDKLPVFGLQADDEVALSPSLTVRPFPTRHTLPSQVYTWRKS